MFMDYERLKMNSSDMSRGTLLGSQIVSASYPIYVRLYCFSNNILEYYRYNNLFIFRL
jgi:hypothetical protein